MLIDEILANLEAHMAEKLLPEEAYNQYLSGALSKKHLSPLAETISRISGRYVEKRSSQMTLMSKEEEAKAYALYYLSINAAKVLHLIRNIIPELTNSAINILDYGAGPGTASLAATFSNCVLSSIDIVEPSPAMRNVAKILTSSFSKELPTNITAELTNSSSKRYEAIFLTNVLNELDHESRLALIYKLKDRLASNGKILIIEPALKFATQELMLLRDQIFEKIEGLYPLFPCPHSHPCQMRATEPDNWCHTQISWEAPPLVKQIDEATGFNKHRIKFASLVLTDHENLVGGSRVVEDPIKRKYGYDVKICSAELYGIVQINKKRATEWEKKLSAAEQFDLVS